MSINAEWFSSWFDTPYYHKLYEHRDHEEAENFIDALFAQLNLGKKDKIMDLACGRGRHAIYMNAKGHDVVGYDLSEESIAFAQKIDRPNLKFAVRDMRDNLGENEFDWVFNLFTSFGYFEQEKDDEKAMKAIAKSLKSGGKLVLDFMNAPKVARRLVPEEVKTTGGIEFHIQRYTEGAQIVKEITFTTAGKKHRYEERVKRLSPKDFNALASSAGLEITDTFGSLSLEPFHPENSDRFIMIAQKK